LEQPLQLISEPQRRDELQAYVNAARPHVERAAFDVLSQLVTAFNDASPELRARLEYSGGGLQLAIEPAPEEPEPETSFNDSDLEKVTLRLPRELKELIDRAAGRHGISANNWYVRELSRTIARHLHESMRQASREERQDARRRGYYRGRSGSSLRGFVGGEDTSN
jgi:predicted HicB family RNase H-like nuclease